VETGLWRDPLRVADSTPVGCGQSKETAKRSDLAGFAGYGSCADRSRHFWGLRLHLVTTIHGLPVTYALASPKTDEREVLLDLFDTEAGLLIHPRVWSSSLTRATGTGPSNGKLTARDVTMIRPSYKGEQPRLGRRLLRAVRQNIEFRQLDHQRPA
jgi:hypothetical protein